MVRYVVFICVYMFITVFLRLKFILFFAGAVYLGVTTNFLYFLMCRGLLDIDEFIMGLSDIVVAHAFPLRQW